MIIAAVQYKPPKMQPVEAQNEIVSLAKEAASNGAQLIVFPEMATSGYIFKNRSEILPYTEYADGSLFQALSPVARTYKAWIVAGFPERDKNDALYNAALIITSTGECAACYRKVLLYDADKTWAHAGDTRMIFDTHLGRMFPGICMDINDDGFSESARVHGAEIIPFCTNWIEEGIDVWAYWQSRLADFTGCFIAANTWGYDDEIQFSGNSAIFADGMKLMAHARPSGNEIIYAEILPPLLR